MSIYEAAALIVAVAFAVLIACLAPILIQFRKTVAETGDLLARTRQDLPALITEMRTMSQSVTDLAEQLRYGVSGVNGFLHAIGEVGDTVHHMHDAVRGKSGMLLTNVSSVIAGVRAATAFIKRNHDR